MKKLIILLASIFITGLYSCHNEDWNFPNYKYSTVYFPFQYPFRTLVLGDYETDNTNDNNLRFIVYAHIGGMYENTKNQTVSYELAPSLADRLNTSLKDSLKILPSAYYTISPQNDITIPKGTFMGGVTVQLTDAFLDDTMAYRRRYVLPLRITDSSLDSILSGKTMNADADPRISGKWDIVPKNFVLYGIKFINKYHGKYLHRGVSVLKNASDVPLDTFVYHQKYVEKDELWSLATAGRNTVTVKGVVRGNPSPGSFTMDLTFDSNNHCVITKNRASAFDVTGTGEFVEDGDNWGNKPRNAMHLNYQVITGTNKNVISDTIVIRDRAVTFEEFVPVVY